MCYFCPEIVNFSLFMCNKTPLLDNFVRKIFASSFYIHFGMQNELIKSFVHEISIWKIPFFWSKSANFFLSAQNASICIRMHQNVCKMNCANVLCTKLSKKWFLLHLNRLKCINMHRNASKCMQNELFLCFMHEISIWKIQFFWSKSANFFL